LKKSYQVILLHYLTSFYMSGSEKPWIFLRHYEVGSLALRFAKYQKFCSKSALKLEPALPLPDFNVF